MVAEVKTSEVVLALFTKAELDPALTAVGGIVAQEAEEVVLRTSRTRHDEHANKKCRII